MIVRRSNILGQQRYDVSHFRAWESSVAYDFDILAGRIMAGLASMVVTGFNIVMTDAVGSQASTLQMVVANSMLMHPLASEAGTIFSVPSDQAAETLSTTNTAVEGSFTAGQVNYVGIDLRLAADDDTNDLVQFLDANTLEETPKTVPLARTMHYVIVISTSDFDTTPALAPVAKVTTDASNAVTAIEDARALMYRLGSGGSTPDIAHAYEWPGSRSENLTGDVFAGGDKSIGSLKEWMDSVMTRLWEIGGGAYWYSPTADRNVQMVRGGTTFSSGEYFEWDATNLHWRGLTFVFDNGGGSVYYNTVSNQTSDSSGLTDLSDGECIYVDLDRTSNAAVSALKATTAVLGSSTIPGARQIIAWRVGAVIYTRDQYFPVGSAFAVASTSALGMVKLSVTPGAPLAPVVFNPDSNGSLTVAPTAGNVDAIIATGRTFKSGVDGTGGPTSGTGVTGHGGASNGYGVNGLGSGSGAGVTGTGGSSDGYGGEFYGGNSNGAAVYGAGTGTGQGGDFHGGHTDGTGVKGTGGITNGKGVEGLGVGTGTGVQGTGGATDGIGVKAIGTAAGAGVDTVGGATGPAIKAQQSDSANYGAMVQYRDSAANLRSYVDHLGFPGMGDSFAYDTFWNWGFSFIGTAPGGLTFTGKDGWDYLTTSVNSTVAGATSTLNAFGSVLEVSISGGTGSAEAWVVEDRPQVCTQTYVSCALEFWVYNTHAAGTGGMPAVGLVDWAYANAPPSQHNPDGLGNGSACLFVTRAGTNNNWWVVTKTGAANADSFDTSIAFAATTWYKMRIEWHGSGSIYGSCVKYFINGALVHTCTTAADIPATGLQLAQYFGSTRFASTATWTVFVSHTKLRFNAKLDSYEEHA